MSPTPISPPTGSVTVRWIQPAHYRGMEEVVLKSRVRRGLLTVGNIVFVRYKRRCYKAHIVALPVSDPPPIIDLSWRIRNDTIEEPPQRRGTPNEPTSITPSPRVAAPLQPPSVVNTSGSVNSPRQRGVVDTSRDSVLGDPYSAANPPGRRSTRSEKNLALLRELSITKFMFSNEGEPHICISEETLDDLIYMPCSRAVDRLLDLPAAPYDAMRVTLSVLRNEVRPLMAPIDKLLFDLRLGHERCCVFCMGNILDSAKELSELVDMAMSLTLKKACEIANMEEE